METPRAGSCSTSGAILLAWRFFTRSPKAKIFTDYLRSRGRRSGIVEPVSVEELMVASGGYGVVRADICTDWPMIGQTPATSGLRQKDFSVQVIRREGDLIANPFPDMRIRSGDSLLCFEEIGRHEEGIRN